MSKSALQQLLEDAGYECQSYSGRNMMGKECLGVRVDETMGSFFANVLDNLVPDTLADYDYLNSLVETFHSMKSDNLGHDTIIYFPNTEYSEVELGEEGLYQVFVVAHADDWHVAYEGTDENEARKVFDAYVGSNLPVDLMLAGKTILTHENGVVSKPEENDDE